MLLLVARLLVSALFDLSGSGKDVEKLFQSPDSEQEDVSSATSTESWGVIPRAISTLFEELRSISGHGSAGIVYLSYMQVYNNDVYDLLRESSRSNSSKAKGQRSQDEALTVREMIKGNGRHIYVSGLSEFRVTNVDEALRFLRLGNRNRTIRATEYNEKSSRSHAVLQLSVEVESRGMESAATIIRRAKLNLVDLAGSEKWATDAVMGADRTKELTSINQSLSALGNVISALTNPRRTHIPYRDSKLTRLLQDSLGGNTRTVVVATISPSLSALEESVSTLQFAERAKCVAVKVRANELVDDAILLAQAQREISRLKLLLKQAKSGNPASAAMPELEEQVKRLTQEKEALVTENLKLRRSVAFLRKSLSKKTAAVDEVYPRPEMTAKPMPSLNAGLVASDASKEMAKVVSPQANQSAARAKRLVQQQPHSAQLKHPLKMDFSHLDTVDHGDSTRKHEVITAFADDDGESRRFQAAEVTERRVLESIQAERRELEKQLEFLAQQELSPRKSSTLDTTGTSSTSDAGDDGEGDERCPVCRRNIDDHSDDELDKCIELEEQQKQRQCVQPPVTQPLHINLEPPEHSVRAENAQFRVIRSPQPPPYNAGESAANGPRAATIPRHPQRRSSSSSTGSSVDTKPSPYLQGLTLKPSTPSSSSSSSSIRAAGSRRTSRPPSREEQADKSASPAEASSSSSSTQSDNQLETAIIQRTESVGAPILRQGHKSVRALKQLHATSPYSLASSKNQKDKLAQPRRERVDAANSGPRRGASTPSNNESAKDPNAVSNSVRDIGLRLSVYKFRSVARLLTPSAGWIIVTLTSVFIRYDCWYPCIVVGYDNKRRLHCCQYDCGDKQWQDLTERKLQVLGRGSDDDSCD